MKFTEKAKALLDSGEIRGEVGNLVEDIVGAATGDLVAAAEAFYFIGKSPILIREVIL